MSLNGSRAKLNDAYKKLRGSFEAVRGSWNDAASRDYETKHLAAMEPKVRATLAALDHMADILGRIRRDCGD